MRKMILAKYALLASMPATDGGHAMISVPPAGLRTSCVQDAPDPHHEQQ